MAPRPAIESEAPLPPNRRLAASFVTPFGRISAQERNGAIVRVEIELPALSRPSDSAEPVASLAMAEGGVLRALRTQIEEYAARRRRSFEIPYSLDQVSPFARDVLEALSTVPFGEVVTYGDLASMAGHAGAARAVGGVMRTNPLPILIPCHRVVAANSIGGFALGLEMKRRLLAIEGVEAA